MRKVAIYKLFAVSSLLLLGILAVSPLKDYFTDWRNYQTEYNRLLAGQSVRTRPVPYGIKQIWAPELDRIDRCISCHLGLSEAMLVGASQPFQPHPRIYHNYEDFGCTVCHNGQGLAASRKESMYKTEYWDKPLLPREYIESSCGTCHRERHVPQADRLNAGRTVIEDFGCVGCHDISSFSKGFAPSLNGIGDKVDRRWLIDWFKNPYELKPNSRMPDFLLSNDDAEALADFLITFEEYNLKLEPLPPSLQKETYSEEMVALGDVRFREARCISCHTIDGRGGPLASELGKISSKVSKQWLYNFLKNPQGLQPGIPMPQYGFSQEELEAVTAYMVSEFVDWERAEREMPEELPKADRFEKGLELFNEYNCAGCHALTYPKIPKNVGPDLTFMGSKPLYELPIDDSSQIHDLPSYIFGKIDDPRQYAGRLRMPRYNFTPEQKIDVTVAILAQVKPSFPSKYIIENPPEATLEPQGKIGEILKKYSCYSCHVINGKGHLLATDLSSEGSQVQRKWLEDYFRLPYTIRPILTERMPNLFMENEEINTLVDYFEMMLVDDAVSNLKIDTGNRELIAQGKELFWEKYGCQSCHQLEGIGGYVGPPLDKTASRLTPGWVYSWISDPHKYRPDTVEPDAGLPEAEVAAITAYLMSKR